MAPATSSGNIRIGPAAVIASFLYQPVQGGGYVAAGQTHTFGAGPYSSWVMRVDAVGAIVWQKVFGGASQQLAHAVRATADGGFVVVGYTYSFGVVNAAAWLFKLDSN